MEGRVLNGYKSLGYIAAGDVFVGVQEGNEPREKAMIDDSQAPHVGLKCVGQTPDYLWRTICECPVSLIACLAC